MESVMPAIAWWRIRPLERKLHWILRLGVVGCFIGHGAYGFLTKEAWLPYFGIVDIDRAWAYRLMPWIGAMDVSLGLTIAVVPLRVVLLHLIVWGLWTAALRPLWAIPCGSSLNGLVTMGCHWPSWSSLASRAACVNGSHRCGRPPCVH